MAVVRWSRLLAGPAARSSHSVTAVAGRVAVFGGEDSPRHTFDRSVHLFSPGGTWHRAPAECPGPALLGHGAVSSGGRLYVFGGRTGGTVAFEGAKAAGGEETGDLHCLDLAAGATAWTRPDIAAAVRPEPRSFHAMCSAPGSDQGSGRFFVFGGCGLSGRLNDLWAFDPDAGTWSCLCPAGGEGPKGRGGSVVLPARLPGGGERLVVVYGFSGQQQGDLAVFDTPRGRWELVPHEAQRGDVPSPRSVFCAAALPDGQHALVFGGERLASNAGHEGAGEFTSDLYLLDLRSLEWRRLPSEGQGPSPRGWGGCAPLPGTEAAHSNFMLFGGLDSSNTRLGDAWQLQLDGLL